MHSRSALLFSRYYVKRQFSRDAVNLIYSLSYRGLTWPQVYKTLFMLSSAETKTYPAHKCKNANNYCHFNIYKQDTLQVLVILPKISIYFGYFVLYGQLDVYAQLC